MIEILKSRSEFVVVVSGELPTRDELDFAASFRLPISISRLPRGVVDLDFLAPIAPRITDLRVFSATLKAFDVVATMTNLQHLRVDDELDLPAAGARGLTQLETFEGSLNLMEGLLDLPLLREVSVVVREGDPLELRTDGIRTLRIAFEPARQSFPAITGNAGITTLGLNDIHDLSIHDIERFPSIEELDLARIRLVRDVSELGRFTSLRLLTLTDVRDVDDPNALAGPDRRVELMRSLPREKRLPLADLPQVTVY